MTLQTFFTEITSEIDSQLQSARESIKVAVAWITNEALLNILCSKALQNISVELILINDVINNSDKGYDLNKLIGCGVKVYLASPDNMMHNKFCILDNNKVITGSFNWTYTAEKYNTENIIIIEDSKEIFQAYNKEFCLLKVFYGQVNQITRLRFTKESVEHSYLASIFEAEKKEIAKKEPVIIPKPIQKGEEETYHLDDIGFAEPPKRFYLKLTDNDKKVYEFWPNNDTLLKKLRQIKFIENEKINTIIIDNLFKKHIDHFNKPKEEREPISLPTMKEGDWPFPNLVSIIGGKMNTKDRKVYINDVKDFYIKYVVPKWFTFKDNGKEYFDWDKYTNDL